MADELLERIREQAKTQALRVTQHAQKEMDEENITLDEVLALLPMAQF